SVRGSMPHERELLHYLPRACSCPGPVSRQCRGPGTERVHDSLRRAEWRCRQTMQGSWLQSTLIAKVPPCLDQRSCVLNGGVVQNDEVAIVPSNADVAQRLLVPPLPPLTQPIQHYVPSVLEWP